MARSPRFPAALAALAALVCLAAADDITNTITNQADQFPVTITTWSDLPVPEGCTNPSKRLKYLPATKDTVHWGYYYGGAIPATSIASGETITVEMLTHQAGDAPDLMIQGDKAMEEIYHWNSSGMNIPFRGYDARGAGKHIMTGPIYICGAEPGDTVKIEILDLYPRLNPKTGKTYGSQAATRWGYQYRTGFKDAPNNREVVTIYELVAPRGSRNLMYAAPRFRMTPYISSGNTKKVTTPCQPWPVEGLSVPRTYPNYAYTLLNPNSLYPAGVGAVPCVNGTQTWDRIVLGGLLRDPAMYPNDRDNSVDGKFRVPTNLHVGNIGLSQPINIPYTTTTPSNTGNNLDNRRLGKGSTMYLPVKVKGGLLQMGDCHTAQGDSEYDGTAIETSVTGDFRITLIKKADAPPHLKDPVTPIFENANEWIVQGHTYDDFIQELLNDTIKNPMHVISTLSDLDRTMTRASINTRDFLMALTSTTEKPLSEDDAISLMTTGIDYAITQVVDQNWGIHTVIPKYLFEGKTDGSRREYYSPKTFPGTSLKGTCTQRDQLTIRPLPRPGRR